MFSTRRLSVLPVLLVAGCGTEPGGVVDDAKPSVPATSGTGGVGEGLPLAEALARLETARGSRDGYGREKFRHWIGADGDGCDTRREVLLAEAVQVPGRGLGLGRLQLGRPGMRGLRRSGRRRPDTNAWAAKT